MLLACLVAWFVGWSDGRSVGWLVGSLVGWSDGRSVGWLVRWSVGRSVGGLVGWLVGRCLLYLLFVVCCLKKPTNFYHCFIVTFSKLKTHTHTSPFWESKGEPTPNATPKKSAGLFWEFPLDSQKSPCGFPWVNARSSRHALKPWRCLGRGLRCQGGPPVRISWVNEKKTYTPLKLRWNLNMLVYKIKKKISFSRGSIFRVLYVKSSGCFWGDVMYKLP